MAKVLEYREKRAAVDAEWLLMLINDEIWRNNEFCNVLYANTPAEDITEGSELERAVIEHTSAVCALSELKETIEKELETLKVKEFEEYV